MQYDGKNGKTFAGARPAASGSVNRNPKPASVLELLQDLIRINSVNPAYEGGQSEAGVAAYLESYFAQHSIDTWRQEALPGRPNLIAKLPGKHPSGKRLIFEAHADTVSAGGMTIAPFEPTVADGRIHGRGSCDTKAGLAAMAYAAASLKRAGVVPECEIWIVSAADEEYSFAGVRRLLEDMEAGGMNAAAAVVSEPTNLRVASASKGVLRWRIHSHGRAAHSAKPHLGSNAIAKMARVVLEIEKENARLQQVHHPLLGPATLNVGLIRGGRQVNIVPDHCSIEVDRRLLPGESITGVLEHMAKRFEPELAVEFESPMLEDEAFETPANEDIVKCALTVSRRMGMSSDPIGVPFGTDASKFSRAGIPSIICGPGDIDLAHTAAESVECSRVERAVEFYRGLMAAFH